MIKLMILAACAAVVSASAATAVTAGAAKHILPDNSRISEAEKPAAVQICREPAAKNYKMDYMFV